MPAEEVVMKIRNLVAAAALAAPAFAHAQVLGFGTAPQGTIGYNMGSAIAKVMADAQLQSRVQPYAGSSAILPLVDSGEMDLTVCNVLEAEEATGGEGPYKGRKQANLRVLGVIFPIHVGFFVKKDSPIQSIADLKGKRIPYGYTAQLTLARVTDALLATGGLSPRDFVPVMVPGVARGADDFAEGKADAGFFALGAAKVSEVDKTVGGIRFLPLPDDAKATAAMKKIIPYAYIHEVKPGPAFAGIAQPTKLMAYDYLVAVGAHVKDDVAYKIAKAIYENKPKLVESLRAFAAFDPQQIAKPMPAPFHPGALKFYREKGLAK
jgi:TRAP transporter TAXI family solute receptor